eukprot:21202_1
MGCIAHIDFKTNIKNVYVTGEAMHDFGANRVGGLPWALYLVAAGVITQDIQEKMKCGDIMIEPPKDFCLSHKKSNFDKGLLSDIQRRMFECLETTTDPKELYRSINWFREQRMALEAKGCELDDAHAWLLLAEAVIVSAINRKESRGCFFRTDYPVSSNMLNDKKSYALLDIGTGNIVLSPSLCTDNSKDDADNAKIQARKIDDGKKEILCKGNERYIKIAS